MSDACLLQAWRHGDLRAGEQLFDRHYQRVYRFFSRKGCDDCADLVQRTFLACVEGKDRIRDGNAFRQYLFSAAHNVLFKRFRGTPGRGCTVLDADERLVDVGVTPSGYVARRRERRRLLEALRGLPLHLQVVLELHYFEGFSMADLSATLGIPLGTVKTRVRRAKQLLRARFAGLEASTTSLQTTVTDLEDWAASVAGHPVDTAGHRISPRSR